MKKILLLGGSSQQIPAIEYAKKKGYYTVLCDYLPDNPGQYFADKFYCVSTTDSKAVLEVAQKENVDGVAAYASDPAAPTAAFVAERVGLPTNSYKSVEILAFKDKFRKFLKENNFNCPKSDNFYDLKKAKGALKKFTFPVMVKPVDSSGSKGVKKIYSTTELEEAFNTAMSLSRSKNVIIEEFIEKGHKYMIGGDCFIINGKVEFWGLLNCHRDDQVNELVPVGKSYPLMISNEKTEEIHQTVQRVVDLLDIKFGGFNLELMFDNTDKLYLIEMGPRNGGNMIPDLLNMITGVDLVAATVEAALGNNNIQLGHGHQQVCYATHNMHARRNGIFKGIEFGSKLQKCITKKITYKKPGDTVEFFDGANKAIGIVFMKFSSVGEMLDVIDNINKLIDVIVE
ncbi:MAG: ATP-grasp domain-containing protein [Clostridiaceae bacterium]